MCAIWDLSDSDFRIVSDTLGLRIRYVCDEQSDGRDCTVNLQSILLVLA